VVNTVHDEHFDQYGHCLDSLNEVFSAEDPAKLDFYVEVSGSMNGFFRPNLANDFKKDVWSVVSNFANDKVSILSDRGTVSSTFDINQFRAKMNSGAFVSTKNTLVPDMLRTILQDLDYERGACAVLISDMKYSPESSKDMAVLLDEYETDIRNEVGLHSGLAVSVVLATSEYLDARGKVLADISPYYYVIFGKDRNVAAVRNYIATLLDDEGDYGGSVEAGFDYKAPAYVFGTSTNAIQLGGEPTFFGYDSDYSDTCSVKVTLRLSDYRWEEADEARLRKFFKTKPLYGSDVEVGEIEIYVNNHVGKQFKREAIAEVEILVSNMSATTSDVVEWSLGHLEDELNGLFCQVVQAKDPNDLYGSFSMDRFISGVFKARPNKWDETPNRILISKTK